MHTGVIYCGGGARGGAILIASSESITIPSGGVIRANGGTACGVGGIGSGGAIRLVAPIISGVGTLTVLGGGGGSGRIRLEAFQQTIPITSISPQTALSTSFPTNSYVPRSSVRIASIDGVPLPQAPAGMFLRPPDVAINNAAPVPVVVQATGIPPGTAITLQVYSDNPNDLLTVNDTYTATLGGTSQASSATVNVLFPAGLSRSFIRVSWVQ